MSGGSANFSGTNLQATFAAWCAVLALAEDKGQLVDALGNFKIERIGAEQNWPMDDCALWMSNDSRAFVQVKETLDSSENESSVFAEVWSQVARQSMHGRGRKAKEELLRDEDRLLIVVGGGTGDSVRTDLKEVLSRLATLPASDSMIAAAQGQAKLAKQLTRATDHLRRFLLADGYPATEADIRAILKLCRVIPVVQDDLRQRGRLFLTTVILEPGQNDTAAFDTLETQFASAGQHRTSHDVTAIRTHLGNRDFRLSSTKSIKFDVDSLNANTNRLIKRAVRPIEAPEGPIVVQRAITARIIAAARNRNIAITSQGGGGKSAVMLQVAEALRSIGERVVFLDATLIDATDIASSLRLEHHFEEVLTRWSEDGHIGFLLIDGFDALRLGRSADSLLSTLESLAANAPKWRSIVASREYDLESSPRMARAFPPGPREDVCTKAVSNERFSHISHAIVEDFASNELDEIFAKSPTLQRAYEQADEPLRAVLRNPFNLSIAATIIGSGVDFSTVRGRLDLLNLWWSQKVAVADRFERRQTLRSIVTAMIDVRRLQIPASRVENTRNLEQLLSDGVLITFGSDIDDIAFPHALLFDYSAYRVSLSTPEEIVDLLRRDRDAFVFVLQSLRFRFETLWDTNRSDFFRLLASIFSEDHTQRLALLVLLSRVIIERAQHSEELRPLLEREDIPTQRTIRYLVRALIRSRQRGEQHVLVRAGVFAEFALQLAHRGADYYHEALLVLSELTEHVDSARQNSSVVEAARYLLSTVLDDEFVSPRLRTMAIDVFLRTYDSDPTENRSVMERLLDAERLAKFGPHDLTSIGYHFRYVTNIDARDLAYQVIFSKIKFPEGQVTMGGSSSLFGFTQDASQPLRSAQWAFAEMYPAVLQASPEVSVRALIAALNEGNRYRRKGAHKFRIGGIDRFFSYDFDSHGEGSYAVDEWRRMLDAFTEKLGASLASGDRRYSDAILSEAAKGPVPTTLLRALLRCAATDTNLAGSLVPVLTKRNILRSHDLAGAAADFIASALPILPLKLRARIEKALLALVPTADSKWERHENERLAAYLQLIPDGVLIEPLLASRRANIGDETFDEERRALDLHGSYIGPATMRALTISDGIADSPLKSLLDEADRLMTHQAVSPAPERLLPLARTLYDLLPTVSEDFRERALDVAAALLEYALARKHAAPSDAMIFEDLLIAAASGKHPEAASDERDEEHAHWGWPNARILAAQILHYLGDEDNESNRALLTTLVNDKAPQVRGRAIESVVGWAHANPEFAWGLVEQALSDRSPAVLHSAISIAARFSGLDPNRYALLERRLYDRLNVERPSAELTAQLQRNLLWRALGGDTEAEQRLDALEHPWADQKRGERLALDLVNVLAHRDAPIRLAARDRLVRLIDVLIRHMVSEAIATGLPEADAFGLLDPLQPSHALRRASAKILIEIAQRLYFDSGAYGAREGKAFGQKAGTVFEHADYEFAKPLVERMSRLPYSVVSYNLLKILRPAITFDPAGILSLIDAVIKAGIHDNLASEQLAQQECAIIVREYIEEHRGLLTGSRESLRIIMDIIDEFSDVGWPEWTDLVFTIDSIYRDN